MRATTKILSVALACACLAIAVCQAEPLNSRTKLANQWRQYKQTFNKSYLDEQDLMRFELFKESLTKIQKHSQQSNFTLGLNHMSDWTQTERRKLLGLRQDPSRNPLSDDISPRLAKLLEEWRKLPLPDSVDWSEDPRRVGPVRDQGQCGSCWAFAVVGLLEGQEYVNSTGAIRELSPQNLVDCNRLNDACLGGVMEFAVSYVIDKKGLEDERDYQYFSGKSETKGKCKFDPAKIDDATRHVVEVGNLPEGDEHSLELAVAHYGPVAIGIQSPDDMFDYRSGIYDNSKCNERPDHSVLAVGYGKTREGHKFWKIKNSWSSKWGRDGYLYMARGKNMCSIASWPLIALYEK